MLLLFHCSFLHKRLQDDYRADSIYQRFIPPVFFFRPGFPDGLGCDHRSEPLIHPFNRNFREFSFQPPDKGVYVFCRFRRSIVHLPGFSDDKTLHCIL